MNKAAFTECVQNIEHVKMKDRKAAEKVKEAEWENA